MIPKYFILLIILPMSIFSQTGWFSVNSGTTDSLYALFFTSAQTGYTVGQNGRIIKTTNGGSNWFSQASGSTQPLTSVKFINSATGIICGQNGIILRTTNSGINWNIVPSGNTNMLRNIFILNQTRAYICGWGSEILVTTNSGSSWSKINFTDTTKRFEVIYMLNETTGIIAGQSGTLLRTVNGGTNWNIIPSDVSKNFYSISFPTSSNGIIAGGFAFSTILVSNDSGVNWNGVLGNAFGTRLYSVWFTDVLKGYACGRNGFIMKSYNGGLNWAEQTTPTTQYLFGIQFTGNDTGYCVGANGTILKTISGGEPIGIKQISSEVPVAFELRQNYPNPFNPTTYFEIRIADFDFVNVKVYDISGCEITILVNDMLKPGTYLVEFDASKLSSGIYFYVLSTKNILQSKKMVLLK